MDTWAKYDAERTALSDDLEGLPGPQWDVQSLCSDWRVRDVVGHLVGGADIKAGSFLAGMIKNGMNFNRYICREGLDLGKQPPESLVTGLRRTVGNRKTPPGAKPVNMLIDTVCHSADIRKPLGINRKPAPETLVEVAEALRTVGWPLGASKRVAGLRLVATDVEWSAGDGPSVEGPAESLILAMAGRRGGLDGLTGEGVSTLSSRL